MAVSAEIRRLSNRWAANMGWPKRLEWLRIKNIRGWSGQRIDLKYPIVAIVGENGVGKSTVLQAAASVYRVEEDSQERGFLPTDFFPDTAWEKLRDAAIEYAVKEGDNTRTGTLRKPTDRWRGYDERPFRRVQSIDLSRIQPVSARTGYLRLAKGQSKEGSSTLFEVARLNRLSEIMGRHYDLARMATTDMDETRLVPIVSQFNKEYSGFHQGAGETTVTEFLQTDIPKYSLVVIDEIETSLHPRAQRRLIRDLADRCRELDVQVILTTHSPYILDELPHIARAHIVQDQKKADRTVVYGVSPEFAMSRMDDVPQYEVDLYVEDVRAQRMLIEVIAAHAPEVLTRCRTIPYGAGSVGIALGSMVHQQRFPRASFVYLDGDQPQTLGCISLPGDDAPERVVFESLKARNWLNAAARTGRPHAEVSDACVQAMTLSDHHDWVRHAATQIVVGGEVLWQALCAEWAVHCLSTAGARPLVQPIVDRLGGISTVPPIAVDDASIEPGRLF
jgi:predicted ATPase